MTTEKRTKLQRVAGFYGKILGVKSWRRMFGGTTNTAKESSNAVADFLQDAATQVQDRRYYRKDDPKVDAEALKKLKQSAWVMGGLALFCTLNLAFTTDRPTMITNAILAAAFSVTAICCLLTIRNLKRK